ncbi:HAD hydrolase family protein [Pullulanibacillus sp. KACC 23026]|uniref:HAD hydrolase family protein n=1 Tax=Pullulanibacillus sp. KACC 23026 TaxID=3028315 RepID=UPI0023B1520E|nr:HAD hydrolase family protein [Pullulanibacillus sp. KACC 23026]WEG14623.1 HAD hydrolase family protein [Pullulanibacillus sp. KACC 23026]
MILFTSDLDRTLIYSNTMMERHPIGNGSVPVEYKEDQIISYMSRDSINLLQKINRKHLFVPVTTRAFYQYKRIHAFQDEMKPRFAIVANGGTILIDGKQDLEWAWLIKQRLQDTSSPKEDMLKSFAKIRHDQWVEREFNVDDFFYMFHINRQHLPLDEIQAFQSELEACGWTMFVHGNRKLYLLPKQLNKALAVSHLQTYVDYEFHAAAGDSLMDYDMLLQADYGFSPKHGELFERRAEDAKIKWLNKMGAGSTEELLETILQLDLSLAGKKS